MRNTTTPCQQPTHGALRFKNRKQMPAHRLPFVGRVPGAPLLSFWDVPKTGGYIGGNETGAALARIYLRYLREHGQARGAGVLRLIALDMIQSGENVTDAEQDARRGQVVGFFTELDRWLSAAAKHLDGGLDKHDDE